jgi:hypothetical protein
MLVRFFNACFSDLYHACYYCILPLTVVVSLTCFRKVDKAFKWICVLISFTCISEFTALFIGLKYGRNGIVYDLFIPIEYFIYAQIYACFLANKKLKKILLTTTVVLLVLSVVNIIFLQSPTEVPTNTFNIEMVMLVFLSLLLFIKIREEPVYENILKEGAFWFNSAVLFYYSFNILIWGFYGIIYNMKDPPEINGNMLLLSSALLYVIFIFSVLLNFYSSNKLSAKNV